MDQRSPFALAGNIDGQAWSALAWSPDGKSLVAVGQWEVGIWDSASGQLRQTLQADVEPEESVSDRVERAARGNSGFQENRRRQEEANRKAQVLSTLKTEAAWGADSRRIAVIGKKGEVAVWDALTGERQFELRSQEDESRWISAERKAESLSWSPDGSRLATAHNVKNTADAPLVRLWDANTGAEILTLTTSRKGQNNVEAMGNAKAVQLAWSPDSRRLAAQELDGKGDILIWNALPEKSIVKPQPPMKEKPAPAKDPYITNPSGLKYHDIVVGKGALASAESVVELHYTAWTEEGSRIDSSIDRGKPVQLKLTEGQAIKGWLEGLPGMRVGGKRRVILPPALGYGDKGFGGIIRPNAILIYEFELLKVL